MEIYELVGFKTGLDSSGVNFLAPYDAFEELSNCFIYKQQLKSRKGFSKFVPDQLEAKNTVLGIFNFINDSGITELLVVDKSYLYRYSTVSNNFVKIPFTSAIPITDFGIINDYNYISGCSYSDFEGKVRFVFTSSGMSEVYFYDGSGVKIYTNSTDNPQYKAYDSRKLVNAKHVKFFNGRINFFSPTLDSKEHKQMILYSGIKDSSGKGDKFDVAGSGYVECDTYENMQGASILGNHLLLTFTESKWYVSKTEDAFNPYIINKIPCDIGSDCPYGDLVFNNSVYSFSKKGITIANGNNSERIDFKIPYFSRDEVEKDSYANITSYFDTKNAQILFSYIDSEYSSSRNTNLLVYNYEEQSWATFKLSFSVFGETNLGKNLVWKEINSSNNAKWAKWKDTDEIWKEIGTIKYKIVTLAGDNEGYIYKLNVGQDDYSSSIIGITKATNAVISITDNNFVVGDTISLKNINGMTELNGKKYEILATTSNSITINCDTTDYSTYISDGLVSSCIYFRAQMKTFNPYRAESRKCYISRIDIMINKFAESIDLLVSDGDYIIKDTTVNTDLDKSDFQIVSVTINHEAEFFNIALSKVNSNTQIIIESIKIYAKKGAYL